MEDSSGSAMPGSSSSEQVRYVMRLPLKAAQFKIWESMINREIDESTIVISCENKLWYTFAPHTEFPK